MTKLLLLYDIAKETSRYNNALCAISVVFIRLDEWIQLSYANVRNPVSEKSRTFVS